MKIHGTKKSYEPKVPTSPQPVPVIAFTTRFGRLEREREIEREREREREREMNLSSSRSWWWGYSTTLSDKMISEKS